jgi:hypothetical protein
MAQRVRRAGHHVVDFLALADYSIFLQPSLYVWFAGDKDALWITLATAGARRWNRSPSWRPGTSSSNELASLNTTAPIEAARPRSLHHGESAAENIMRKFENSNII